MTKTTTTYALPPEPDGPVWDEDGNKWERDGDYWRSGAYYGGREWSALLRDHGPLTNTEPIPDWPTAPFLWHDGEVWTRLWDGRYGSPRMSWDERALQSAFEPARDAAARFAREAVPVTLVPAEAWEAWRRSTNHRECHRTEAELMNATDVMTGW